MGTFLELYQTLIGFVHYKLYSELNLVYPPTLDINKDEGAVGLTSLILESKDKAEFNDVEMTTVRIELIYLGAN